MEIPQRHVLMREAAEDVVKYLVISLHPSGTPFARRVENEGTQSSPPIAIKVFLDHCSDVLCASVAWTRRIRDECVSCVLFVLWVRRLRMCWPAESRESDEAFLFLLGNRVLVNIKYAPECVKRKAPELFLAYLRGTVQVAAFVEKLYSAAMRCSVR